MRTKSQVPPTLKKIILCGALALLIIVNPALCQSYRVQLDTLTTEGGPTDHVEVFTKEPVKKVKLPVAKDISAALFAKVFYSWAVTRQPDVVVMVVPRVNGEELYIDKNNNQDLTDDGPAGFFSSDSNSYDFTINSTNDEKQKVHLRFYRKPAGWNSPDSINIRYFDSLGNLNPNFARFWGMSTNKKNFTGRKGEFYWDDRVTLRRGSLLLEGKSYSIGLFDWSNNGLYSDSDDVVIVDVRGKGILSIIDQTQVFKLNDVFLLAGRNFKIHDLDKYGTWVELEETSQPSTSYLIQEQDSVRASGAQKTEISPAIWDVAGTTFDGSLVSLSSIRGKFLLLNFWGEWCKPCVEEIPALVRARQKFPTAQIEFISFVKVGNIDKAKKLIADMRITWPQILLGDEVAEKLGIRGFPTNILIFPNGRECLITGAVSGSFFDMYVR